MLSMQLEQFAVLSAESYVSCRAAMTPLPANYGQGRKPYSGNAPSPADLHVQSSISIVVATEIVGSTCGLRERCNEVVNQSRSFTKVSPMS